MGDAADGIGYVAAMNADQDMRRVDDVLASRIKLRQSNKIFFLRIRLSGLTAESAAIPTAVRTLHCVMWHKKEKSC